MYRLLTTAKPIFASLIVAGSLAMSLIAHAQEGGKQPYCDVPAAPQIDDYFFENVSCANKLEITEEFKKTDPVVTFHSALESLIDDISDSDVSPYEGKSLKIDNFPIMSNSENIIRSQGKGRACDVNLDVSDDALLTYVQSPCKPSLIALAELPNHMPAFSIFGMDIYSDGFYNRARNKFLDSLGIGKLVNSKNPDLEPTAEDKARYFANLKQALAADNQAKIKAHWTNVLGHQPWLRWDMVKKSYEYEESGADHDLLIKLKAINGERANVELYRGTYIQEKSLLMMIQKLGKTKPDYNGAISMSKDLVAYLDEASNGDDHFRLSDEVVGVLHRLSNSADLSAQEALSLRQDLLDKYAIEQISYQGMGALFVSHERGAAQWFADKKGPTGAVLTFDVPFAKMESLLKADGPQLFLGIETAPVTGIEIAFRNAIGIEVLADSLSEPEKK